mgnify:CR=1 FL=1
MKRTTTARPAASTARSVLRWAAAVRKAADKAQTQGFLLAEDAQRLLQAAQASAVLR